MIIQVFECVFIIHMFRIQYFTVSKHGVKYRALKFSIVKLSEGVFYDADFDNQIFINLDELFKEKCLFIKGNINICYNILNFKFLAKKIYLKDKIIIILLNKNNFYIRTSDGFFGDLNTYINSNILI